MGFAAREYRPDTEILCQYVNIRVCSWSRKGYALNVHILNKFFPSLLQTV